MKFSTALSAFALASTASASFDINSKNNVAVYWGQSSAGFEKSLGDYCATTNVDIVLLSFLSSFPDNLHLDMSGSCGNTYPNGMLNCPNIGADIKACQARGVKVLLSMGGYSGSYGFSSDWQAAQFADTLWNLFGEGSSNTRPYHDAVVDGFDFDLENGNPTGYVALANALRSKFATGSKKYYLSAAPQCYFPDRSDNDLLTRANVDFAFIQFYNNWCNIGPNFNWNTWSNFASNTAGNRNMKLFLGLPGSPSAAGSGYVDINTAASTIRSIRNDPHFAGVMVWDASQGFNNHINNGQSYIGALRTTLYNNGFHALANFVNTNQTETTDSSADTTGSTVTLAPTTSVTDASYTPESYTQPAN